MLIFFFLKLFVFFVLCSHNAVFGKCLCLYKNEKILQQQELAAFLVAYSRWRIETVDNHQQFTCFLPNDITNSARSILTIAIVAEQQQHHPDIVVTTKGVTLSIYTHAQNALTFKDVAFVHAIEKVLALEKKTLVFLKKNIFDRLCSFEEVLDFVAKNQYWQMDADKSSLVFSYDSSSFEIVAKALVQCCLLESMVTQLAEMRLSYGTCSIVLRSEGNLITSDTLSQAKVCQRIFDDLLILKK